MGEKRRRRATAPTREQLEERFDTGGKSFTEALESVLAGGPDDHASSASDDGKADE